MNSQILVTAAKWHDLMTYAADNGGVGISAAGGSTNVAAGELSHITGCSYEQAHDAIRMTAPAADWYADLYHSQAPDWDDNKFSAEALMRDAFCFTPISDKPAQGQD